MAEIAFHAEASADVERIYRFSLAQFGEATADDYHAGLFEAVTRLATHPEIGREEAGIVPPVRILVYRSHKLYYRFDGERVFVVRILHHAMNAAAHLIA